MDKKTVQTVIDYILDALAAKGVNTSTWQCESPNDIATSIAAVIDKTNVASLKLKAALELLREIRDQEVNPEDEADKFLRDHELSELSKIKILAKDLLDELITLQRHGGLNFETHARINAKIKSARIEINK